MLDGLSPATRCACWKHRPGPAPPAGLRRVRAAQVGRRRGHRTDPTPPEHLSKETSTMGYTVNGNELETDDQGYLLEPDFSDEVVQVIAAAEGITLTDDHWKVVAYLRDEYRDTATRPTSATCSRAWPTCCRLRQQVAVRPVPHRPGQAGLQGGRPAAAAGQGRVLMLRRRQRTAGATAHEHARHAPEEPLVQGRCAQERGRAGQCHGLHRLARGAATCSSACAGRTSTSTPARPTSPSCARCWCSWWRSPTAWRTRGWRRGAPGIHRGAGAPPGAHAAGKRRPTCWAPAAGRQPRRHLHRPGQRAVTQHYAEFGADPEAAGRSRLPARLRLRALPGPPLEPTCPRRTAAGSSTR
jgi:hypothetical protein